MNFDFLKPVSMIQSFYLYCSEAEKYALSNPDIGCAAALKANEYIIRLVYTAAIQNEANQLTVFDMLCSPDFVMYLDDRTLLNAIHLVRKKGYQAVHQGGLTPEDARETVEQLHFVAGEICIFLGLIHDYPAFDASVLPETPEEYGRGGELFDEQEPSVEEEIIARFTQRLQSVERYSELRSRAGQFVNIHVRTADYDEMEKAQGKQVRVSTSTNVRTCLQMLTDWMRDEMPDWKVTSDPRSLVIYLEKEGKEISIAVRMGCCFLGVMTLKGEWLMLQGAEYAVYCFDIDPSRPPQEQFRLFTKEEFLNMWKELDLIIPKISTSKRKKLKEMYGPDFKFKNDEHGDTLAVQTFITSRKKTKRFEELIAKFPVLTIEEIRKVCEDSKMFGLQIK